MEVGRLAGGGSPPLRILMVLRGFTSNICQRAIS